MIDRVTVLFVVCLGLLVSAAVVVEVRRRYLRVRQDQRLCRLTRSAML
jgi:hypothetical protein